MEKLLEVLSQLEFPQVMRENVGGKYEGFVLGLVNSWAGKGEKAGSIQIPSRRTEMGKYEEIKLLSFDILKKYDPEFKFTTIQFNKNKKMVKHIDGRNIGESYILGLGDYEGGELIVYDNNDIPTKHDIKNKYFKFDGSKYYHEVGDFTGNRYTLVFYHI
tara:strand:- start:10105 stop:10584 length:480 start_codon:yes stop_codon:yes gene_type:complete